MPEEFNTLIQSTLKTFKLLATRIDPHAHKALTVFVDPIDGTREFATGQGDYVSMLIGYNDALGKPVAVAALFFLMFFFVHSAASSSARVPVCDVGLKRH